MLTFTEFNVLADNGTHTDVVYQMYLVAQRRSSILGKEEWELNSSDKEGWLWSFDLH
jgi:hypothetical protein